jgi:uncharacterized protein (TIGR03437 family)
MVPCLKFPSLRPHISALWLVVAATFFVGLCDAQQLNTPVQWTSLGPSAIPGASGTSGSGKIQTFAICASNPLVMYAGGGVGSGTEGPDTAAGVFKTTDGGAHWTSINNGITDSYVDAVWVDPNNPDNVLVGTEITGIFHSTDGGQSWTSAGTPIQTSASGAPVTTQVITVGSTSDFATFGSTILAANMGGVAASSDGGATWSIVYKTAARVLTLQVQAGVVAIGTAIGNILYQPSGGSTFSVLLAAGIPVSSVAVDAASPTTVYAALSAGTLPFAVTKDLKTWTRLAPPVAPQALAVTPDTHVVYEGTASGLYSSVDSGQTWKLVPGPAWNVRHVYTPDDSTIIVGTDEGVYETTNGGGQWTSLTAGISNSVSTGVSAFGPVLLTTAEGFNPPISYDGGDTWSQSPAVGQNGSALINAGNPNYCYLFSGNGFQVSADACQTFKQPSGIGGTPFSNGTAGAGVIAVDLTTPSNVYVATAKGVYQSSDFGQTLNATTWGFSNLTAIAVDPADGKTILVANNVSLNRTSDGGQTWSQITTPGSGYPVAIAFSPQVSDTVLIALSNGADKGGGVIKSTNAGATFTLSNSGLPTQVNGFAPGMPYTSLRIGPNGSAALATNFGVFLSADTGTTWQNVTPFGTQRAFNDVAWDGPYKLYAASQGAGILYAQPFGASPIALQTDAQPIVVSAVFGSTTVTTSNAAVTTSTGDTLTYFAIVKTNSGTGWLTASGTSGVTSGTTPGSVAISVNPAGLNPGVYTGQISLASSSTNNSPLTIPVSLTVNAPAGNVPVIFAGGIVPASSTIPTISSSTWVSIYGLNLAPALAVWNNDFPTTLGNVTVTIDKKPAYLWFVSPGQINLQVPNDQTVGPVQVVVTTPAGSVTATVNFANVSPSVLLFDSRYPAAVIPVTDGSGAYGNGTYDELGPTGHFSFSTRPVKVGEVLVLYGTGFGGLQGTSVLAGQPFSGQAPIGDSILVLIDNVIAPVQFAGLVSAGLYQVNVVVPQVPSGDQLLKVGVGGSNAQSGIYVPIQ